MLTIVLIAVAVVIATGFVSVPTNHYGVITFLGKKLQRTLDEGLGYTYPLLSFLGNVRTYSYELQTDSLSGDKSSVVITKDNLEIRIEGSIQWRPDKNALLKHTEMTREAIFCGMRDAIEEGLGEIAGQEKADSFYKKREAVSYLINSFFKLERRPDYHLPRVGETPNGPKDFANPDHTPRSYVEYLEEIRDSNMDTKDKAKALKKLQPSEWTFNLQRKGRPLDVLSFYQENITRVVLMLRIEEQYLHKKSPVEELYAIDIETFKLAKISYSPETMASLEDEKQAENRNRAYDKEQRRKIKFMKQLINLGVDPNKASDDADAMIEKADKNVISGSGALPFLNLNKGGKS